MTVKQLVARLKEMPQDLEVGIAAFDALEWSAGDWVLTVYHIVKSEYLPFEDDRMLKDMPSEYVVLHG